MAVFARKLSTPGVSYVFRSSFYGNFLHIYQNYLKIINTEKFL